MKQTLLQLALAGLAVTLLTPRPAAASDQDDVMKTVHQWVDSLNKGDTKSAIAACAEQTSIVDEFPPHEWHGEGACAKWMTELEAYNHKLGLTNSIVTLRKPRRVDITADRAYVVAPADFHFKENGRDGTELGALFTVALQKSQAGWRITGWAWSRP
jgi:ketosteroid isomerase-like protein